MRKPRIRDLQSYETRSVNALGFVLRALIITGVLAAAIAGYIAIQTLSGAMSDLLESEPSRYKTSLLIGGE